MQKLTCTPRGCLIEIGLAARGGSGYPCHPSSPDSLDAYGQNSASTTFPARPALAGDGRSDIAGAAGSGGVAHTEPAGPGHASAVGAAAVYVLGVVRPALSDVRNDDVVGPFGAGRVSERRPGEPGRHAAGAAGHRGCALAAGFRPAWRVGRRFAQRHGGGVDLDNYPTCDSYRLGHPPVAWMTHVQN